MKKERGEENEGTRESEMKRKAKSDETHYDEIHS